MANRALPLILISGATATGKTGLAVHLASILAQELEVVNADSLLFYKELNIGTAKPTLEEQKGVAHHLIDVCSAKEPLNASDYCKMALSVIDKIHSEGKIPVIVGGSSFYIRALIKGMYDGGSSNEEDLKKIRIELQGVEDKFGWQALRKQLKEFDLDSFTAIHENDRYRTLRALEYYHLNKKPISLEKQKMEEFGPYDFSTLQNPQWRLQHIYLELPKDQHWKLMEERAQGMINNGLLEEINHLISEGFSLENKPLQSIGYKECLELLAETNQLSEKQTQELVERIYINTRRLAKSQKTFFKKITPKNTYNPALDRAKIVEDTQVFLKQFCHDG